MDWPVFNRSRIPRRLLLPLLLACLTAPLAAANDTRSVLEARRYTIDPFRSYLSFSIGFMKVKTVEGTFHDYSGTIMYAEQDVARSTVSAVVEAESIFTGVRARDRHLRTSDFFDTDRYPHIAFRSTRIQPRSEGWDMAGTLTLHGQSREVTIRCQPEPAAGGGERLSFRGELQLRRRDYGVIGNFWGNQVLGDEVTVELHIEAVPVEEGTFSSPGMTPRSLGQALLEPALAEEPEALGRAYRELKDQAPSEYDFGETGLLDLAVALRKRGDLEAAARVLRFNLSLFPRHLASRDFLGYLEALQGRTAEAIRTYRELQLEHPRHPGVLEMLRWLETAP